MSGGALALKQPSELDLTTITLERDELISQAGRVVVENDAQEKLAGDLLKMVKSAIKKAEDERTSIVKPFNDGVKAINARYKEITDPLQAAKDKIEKAMKPYALQKLKKQQEDERLAREALEKQALDKAAQAATPEAAEEVLNTAVVAADRVAQPSTVRGTYGSVTSKRIKYDFEISDVGQVPREYLIVDEKKVRAAINGSPRVESIPGILIKEDVQFSSR